MTVYRQVTVLSALFLLIGVSLLIASVVEVFDVRTFVSSAQTAVGHVVGLEDQSHVSKGQSVSGFVTVFEFSDANGKSHICRSSSAENPAPYQIGDAVTVLYRQESPQDARIRHFRTLWLLPTILSSVGAVFTIVGLVTFVAGRKSYGPKR
jgi:hypothetical protein